ncbi:hypothetical protein GCM10020220_000310 [Nonomuraea rubra]
MATAALTGLAMAGLAWPSTAAAGAEEQKTYLVRLAAEPVATYEGDVAGLARTKPAEGEKIETGSAEVTEYVEHLKGRHDAALRKAGGRKLYEYVYSYEGFAARMTADQAAKMRALPEVVSVTEDRKVSVATSSTPAFLGLDARGGLWDRLGGPTGGRKDGGAGDGLVIGVIDSGIWASSQSFANPDKSGKRYGPLRGFHGGCAQSSPDQSWDATLCNGKIVAARHFNAGWGGDAAVKEQLPWEFQSPRDYNGHGTHTASTAGGNHDVTVTGPAAAFGEISGIAPRARIAAYKALWSTQDASTANGYYSDLVAAIDQAVADGVDVINYSVSGTSTDLLDPAELAFLAAAEAGVFVAAAGGNDGPGAATVAHPSPWVTTVAAGTHNRGTKGSATLGNGASYAGVAVAATKAGPAPLVDAAAAAVAGADPVKAAQCWAARDNGGTAVLDPAKVKGKIVLCDRGTTPRVNKSVAVSEAGGLGVILANTDENSLNADLHPIPTVHLAVGDRQAVKDYAATAGATATVEQASITTDVPAPYVAAFSSRGPLQAAGGDLLKPDLIAPGQDILAAYAPPGANGLEFNVSSGTSMAAPARGRAGRAAEGPQPALVPDGHQVGPDDQRLRRQGRPVHRPVGHLRPGRRARHPEQRRRPRPRLRQRHRGLDGLPLRQHRRRRARGVRRAGGQGPLLRRQRPERALDRHRQAPRHAAGDPRGDQRGPLDRHVHRLRHRPRRDRRQGVAEPADAAFGDRRSRSRSRSRGPRPP